jgi:hypothetical protein
MNVNAFRQRLGRTTNGKYSETELVDRIKDECAKFVEHICHDIAPYTDIMDLEQVVNAQLGYPFALELMHYSAWADKETHTLKEFAKALSQLSAARAECQHCIHRNFNENSMITCDLVRNCKKCYLEEPENGSDGTN